jgi:tyrosine-protein kinase Etk/Wzc
VLAGKTPQQPVFTIPSAALDVLAANFLNSVDPYELLAAPQAAQRIDDVSREYDNVIIDTPPVLAFPDALLWAKMTGVVIITGFAGHTTAPDLKETKYRLTEIGVRILGTVLCNVPVGHSYYRYGYEYYSKGGRSGRNNGDPRRRPLLLPMDNPEKKPGDLPS